MFFFNGFVHHTSRRKRAELIHTVPSTEILIHGNLTALPLPKLDVYDEKDDAKEEADAAHSNVGNAQEAVLTPKEAGSGEDHAFPATKLVHWIPVMPEIKCVPNK